MPQVKLQDFCEAFHCLDRETKAVFLQTVYGCQLPEDDSTICTTWKLVGLSVCVECQPNWNHRAMQLSSETSNNEGAFAAGG